MSWKAVNFLWKFLPADRAVSFSVGVFGGLIALGVVLFLLGRLCRKRWVSRAGPALCIGALLIWGTLYATRPAWLRIASETNVPNPAASPLVWRRRAPGLDTAELELRVRGDLVDHMALVRIDPQRYHLTVHWDSTGTRTAEDWQRELGAAVVVNGSYFGPDFSPLTPLRVSGRSVGPLNYASAHGAFVANGSNVAILDLANEESVTETIGKYSEALVSYPLLIDSSGANRSVNNPVWLASRNFVAIDREGRVILGTTETGFFTLYRLGEFLKSSALDLRLALNLDGGPLASQVARAGAFTRNFHGKAEMSNRSDVLRAFWHEHSRHRWTLPIVLVAIPNR